MKCVILAGGKGSRISEISKKIPKPMVEIGGKPIIWHIMKIYSYFGYNEFVILLGYKGYVIKEYFTNYYKRLQGASLSTGSNTGLGEISADGSFAFSKGKFGKNDFMSCLIMNGNNVNMFYNPNAGKDPM